MEHSHIKRISQTGFQVNGSFLLGVCKIYTLVLSVLRLFYNGWSSHSPIEMNKEMDY